MSTKKCLQKPKETKEIMNDLPKKLFELTFLLLYPSFSHLELLLNWV